MLSYLRLTALWVLGSLGGCATGGLASVQREDGPSGANRYTVSATCKRDSDVRGRVLEELQGACENRSRGSGMTLTVGHSEIPIPPLWELARGEPTFVVDQEFPATYLCVKGQFRAVIEGRCVRSSR